MIRYSLACERGHAFESWFQSSSAYDGQKKRKLVNCPMCDSTRVEKAIMAPQIAKKGRPATTEAPSEPSTETPCSPAESGKLVMSPERELRAKLKELRDHVVKTADNVGNRFAHEARKMHYGETDHRAIYGEASPDEAKALTEEGIDLMPMPVLPEDRN